MLRLVVVLCAVLACAACSEPPQKELDRAQGAIDAARAAGAEQYASEPFTAATAALQQAHEAVDQRDYRLALSHALEASERAQEAARTAADGKAAARTRAEATAKTVADALSQLDARVTAAEAAKVTAKALAPTRSAAANAAKTMQEARAAMAAGRYVEALDMLHGLPDRITVQIRAVDDLVRARPAKPSRRPARRN